MAKNISPPYISVIVPMYKVERYIKACIDSILNQTFQDFEIIIVDDASPDNSYDICQKLYGNNKKVRIVRHKQNKGLGPSRNTGIENARGKYVYFVDSDDLILPNALETLYNAAKETNADVIHTYAYYETVQNDDSNESGKIPATLQQSVYRKEGFLKFDIPYRLREHWMPWHTRSMAWLNMCNLEFLKKNNLRFINVISEDELFSFELFCKVEKFYIIKDAFYIYRRHQNSIMKKYDADRLKKGVSSLVVATNYLKQKMEFIPQTSNNPQLQDEVISRMFDSLNGNHVVPFYNGQNINPQMNEIIFNEFLPTFKENTFLVKHLLNLTNTFQKKTSILAQQANALFKENQQLRQINGINSEKTAMLKLIEQLKTTDPKFIFMLTPTHGNLGDQAIVLGEYFIMQSCFPNHKIIEIPYDYMVGNLGKIFSGLGYQKYIRPHDDIVLHGGGNMGNIWLNEEIARRAVIEKFPNNRIVSFPQSVHFTDDAEGQKQAAISSKIYNAHKDLHLMLRDEHSFEVANKLFPNAKTYLLPDIVTALFGQFDKADVQRSGILFALRKDKEKVRNDAIINQLQNLFRQSNIPFSVIDNVIPQKITAENRRAAVSELIMHFRKSRLVITDRFHGVIFSIITRTPVAAFKSYDTKISSGIKWFKDFPSVYYAQNESLEDMVKFIEKAYNGVFDSALSIPPPVWNGFRTALQRDFSRIISETPLPLLMSLGKI